MRPALFLDRDGVVNREKNYVFKIEDFEFLDGVFRVCRHFQAAGYLIIIVTNQAGIARGYYSKDEFYQLNSWMLNEFSLEGISINKVYYCPHHPDYTGPCSCRKPKPGMLLTAKSEFNIDMPNSILVGDKFSDILAGVAAGIGNNFLSRSGHSNNEVEIGSCNIIDNIASLLS